MFTINGEGVPGEGWKRACVVLNSADDTDAEFVPPSGEWTVALDDHGAVEKTHSLGAKITVRYKSGAVLYQR